MDRTSFGDEKMSWEDIWESIKVYPKAIGKYWYLIAISGIGGFVDALEHCCGVTVSFWMWIILGLMIAQFLAWHRIRLERDGLRRFNITEDVLLRLGEYYELLISHQHVKLNDETDLGRWVQQFNVLKAEISSYIAQNISQAEAKLFDRYGLFSGYLFGDELQTSGQPHILHVKTRGMIVRDYRFLEELVKDYARQRGWRGERFLKDDG